MDRSARFPVFPAILAIVALQAAILWFVGRDPGCGCGPDFLWQTDMDPSGNSQYLADPYSFLHFGFGMAVFAILVAMRPHWRRRELIALVILSSAIWEVMENLPFIISIFGYEQGDPQFYDGDSILNSLGDTAFALAGGMLASLVPVWATVVGAIALEVAVSFAIRDGYVIGLLRVVGLL